MGRRAAKRVSLRRWDFLATAAALAGAAVAPGVDGINVLAALRGEEVARGGFFYWEHHQKAFSQAVREGRLKALRGQPGEAIQVYDLVADRSETRDLAASKPGFGQRAAGLFATDRTESVDWPVARPDRSPP